MSIVTLHCERTRLFPAPKTLGGNVKTTANGATVVSKTGPLFIANGTVTHCIWKSPEVGQQINITGPTNGPFTITAVASTEKSVESAFSFSIKEYRRKKGLCF